LKILPPEVRWFYEEYYKAPGKWKKEGMRGERREGREEEGEGEEAMAGKGREERWPNLVKLGKDHLPFFRTRGSFFLPPNVNERFGGLGPNVTIIRRILRGKRNYDSGRVCCV
jgi:hypothetical protein